jgi:GNAT superfamily N-acetyltransferase
MVNWFYQGSAVRNALIACAWVFVLIGAGAHADEKVARLAIVLTMDPGVQIRGYPGFWERLTELGWIRGKNLLVEERSAKGQPERFPALMREVLARKVDVIVTEHSRCVEGAGLGPMAVLPGFQRMGTGSKLIVEGTRRLRARRCPFIVVLGHPKYYPRFGFVPASRHSIRCQWVPDEAFMLLLLDPPRVQGMSGVARYRNEFATVA